MPYDARAMPLEPHMEEWPSTDDPEGIALLRSALVDAGYTPSAVREALATEVASGRDSAELPLYLQMLQNGGQLAALIKLFLLDLEVTAEEAEEALPGLVDRMEAMRVLERRGDTVKALVEIVPTEDLLIACDAFQQELARSDHVLGRLPAGKGARVADGAHARSAGRSTSEPGTATRRCLRPVTPTRSPRSTSTRAPSASPSSTRC